MQCVVRPEINARSSEWPQIVVVLISCLSGVSRGLIYSWTSPAIPALVANPQYNITLEEASYFTIIFPISMAACAPLVFLIEGLGRKVTIMFLAIPQLLSWILIVMANSIWVFYISRAIGGMADAIFYGIVSVYICEITQPKVRGLWAPLASISASVGMLLMNIIGSYNSIQNTAIICSCIPVLQLALFWFMPESPYFLLVREREIEARKSLQLLRWTANVEDEFESLKLDVQKQSKKGTFKDIFITDSNRKAILTCVMLRATQQLSGLSAFETYTQYMFEQAGTNISEKTSSIIFMSLSLVSIIVSAYVVESKGRRPLMIFSCLGCGIILGTLAGYFCLKRYSSLNLQHFTWIPLAEMLIYVIVCSPGMGIIPSLMTGELFSTSIKAKAMCIMNIVLACGYLAVPKLFQSLTENVGIFAPFLLFAAASFIGGILSYLFLIETKGKTLGEIQHELNEDEHESIETKC